MHRTEDKEPTASDQTLIERARAGDRHAFGELWRRHFRSGARVARQFTSSLDADDLVAEAYTRIYQRVLAGGGPTGAFRPYLYTTIRNLASTWGAAPRDITVDDMTAFEDPATTDDPAAFALDRTLTARAFRSLPERWQSVLWYTEVEGMDPHEVAPILGMSANGVAALSYRAREGLRKAWLQAHINDATASGECQWAIARIGDNARHGLGKRDAERMAFHLATCAKCSIISEEVDEVGSRLALVMLPILLGGIAGGTLLASFGNASSAVAASGDAVPAVPEAIGAGGAVVTGVFGFLGAATAPVALIGALVIAVAATGTIITLAPGLAADGDGTAIVSTDDGVAGDAATATTSGGSPANIPTAAEGVIGGAAGDVGDIVDGVLDTITGGEAPEGHTAPGGIVGADLALDLFGTGTPGAHLSLQAAGQVYATTVVGADGSFVLNVTGIPGGLSSLELVQVVDESYLAELLGLGGLLGGVVGEVDALIQGLIAPVRITSGDARVTIILVG
jgi:RNA polymerase sigma factor (sigma-70 family)